MEPWSQDAPAALLVFSCTRHRLALRGSAPTALVRAECSLCHLHGPRGQEAGLETCVPRRTPSSFSFSVKARAADLAVQMLPHPRACKRRLSGVQQGLRHKRCLLAFL